eukprot:4631936-Amphidinium_carterae.1
MNIGLGLAARGLLGEAQVPLKEAVEGNREVLGNSHLHTLAAANNLAYVYEQLEQFEAATEVYRAALPGLTDKFGDQHPRTQMGRRNLAQSLEAQKLFTEAVGVRTRVLEIEVSAYGDLHASTAAARFDLAKTLAADGSVDKAKQQYDRVVSDFTQYYTAEHPFVTEA